MARALGTTCACLFAPRRRTLVVLAIFAVLAIITICIGFRGGSPPPEKMELKMAQMRNQLDFFITRYHAQKEDMIMMEQEKPDIADNEAGAHLSYNSNLPLAPATQNNLTGSKAEASRDQKNLKPLKVPSAFHLMPHLMDDKHSLRPAYHMSSFREEVNIVIGIPTVKRDKESYLNVTLKHLVKDLSEDEANSILIVIMVGETNLDYVVGVANNIERQFPKEVENGLIEVISPSPNYYPDFQSIPPSLGDSLKRTMWRTKQNLDTVFLMAYGQTKGTYYLMLEDDVIAEKHYIKDMNEFILLSSIANPDWVWIQFCSTGGIGKLFRSSEITRFITYVQLFYTSMPIDWLIETYLEDKVCGIQSKNNQCHAKVLKIRPRYKKSLFEHIGMYSSLKGKIVKTKDQKVDPKQRFFPHNNPPVDHIMANIQAYDGHTIYKAYAGTTYFWGLSPKADNYIEFWFDHPVPIESYIFRSGNAEKPADRFYNSVVEVLGLNTNGTHAQVGEFDEFGLAEGDIPEEYGPYFMIRIRALADSNFWVILSEICLKLSQDSEDATQK